MSGPVVCDYSFARPSPGQLKAAGYLGAMRYLAPLPNTKVVTLAEAQAIWAAGWMLGLVWEGVAQEAEAGYPAGVAHAQAALAQADALGWPGSRPIFFVLEDPNEEPSSDWPTIEAYCQGVASVLGAARVGGYGSQALLEHLLAVGLISWGWQVGGWSASVSTVRGMVLYQRLSTTICPPALAGSIDEDAVLQADWGGWDGQPVDPPVPSPPAPPVAAAAPPVITNYPEDHMLCINGPSTVTTDANGWTAVDVDLPAPHTKNDVVQVICDWASGYDPQGWHACTASVDFQAEGQSSPQVARIVFKSLVPNDTFTYRVWVATS